MGQICPMACFCMASKLRMAFTFLKCHLNKEEEEEYTIKTVYSPHNLECLTLYRESLLTLI